MCVLAAGKLYGKINWRISKSDNDFIERSTVQTFKQVCAAISTAELPDSRLHYQQREGAFCSTLSTLHVASLS